LSVGGEEALEEGRKEGRKEGMLINNQATASP